MTSSVPPAVSPAEATMKMTSPSLSRRPAANAATGLEPSLVKAAEQFEGLFVAQMFKAMRQAAESFGTPQDATAGGSAMLDQAYWQVADGIARQHAFGIADCLIAQMSARGADVPLPPISSSGVTP